MRESTFPLRGLTFSGLEWGEPVGVPTVFLHGFLDHAGTWEEIATRLSGWRVALDLRGHGRSPWAGEAQTYHFAEYLADLDALVDHLGGRVRLVGHSMGGTVSSIYAGARPDAVERLAVLDGIGLPDGGAGARSRMIEFLDGVKHPKVPRPLPSVADAARRLRMASRVDEAFALRLAERGTIPVEGGFRWAYDPRHRGRSATPYRHDQHSLFLAAIRCPVLSIHPEHSLFAPEDVRLLEGVIPHLRVECISGTGHMLPVEAPGAVAALLSPFLGE